MEDQLYVLLKKLVLKNNIQLDQEELKLQLESHPSYPSLHSLTGVLSHFGIPNIAIRLQVNKETLSQLPSCFLATIKSENDESIVLVEKKNNQLKVTGYDNKKISYTNEQFISSWNGIILAIEKDENIIETRKSPIGNVLKWVFYGFGIALIAYCFYIIPEIFAKTHFILSIIGVIISIIIVKHEFGLQSKSANSICNLSEHTSCDAVLQSNGAKLLGLFKLSDVCLVIFSSYAGYWLTSLFTNTNNYVTISLLAMASIPMIGYSLFYQYKVVKKWCPLCLGIISVLLFQFTALAFNYNFIVPHSFNIISVIQFASVVLLISAIWSITKPFIQKIIDLKEIEINHYKFKRNFSLFNALLNEGKSLLNTKSIDGELIFGNEHAAVEMVLVTNPFCSHCKKAHSDIENLLSIYGDKIKLTIRFNFSTYEKDDPLYRITSELFHIYKTKGKDACLAILNELYQKDIDLKSWANNRDVHFSDATKNTLSKQNKWCASNNINFTPAFYVNKKPFPKEYSRQDLAYFIDDLTKSSSSIHTVSNKELIAS